ncbi:MAG: Bug family tripartite tricarboxylate transporter substrate binding protein [Burkholderiaceae bacterium]
MKLWSSCIRALSPRRRLWLRGGAAALAAAALSSTVAAASFPVAGKPIRIIVPFPPGGQTDLQARMVAPLLAEALGARVVVENKPGGNMVIAAQEVIRAEPDGHTLLYANGLLFTRNPLLYTNLPYDPFRDFTAIAQFVQAMNVLVASPKLPVRNLKELVEHAKASPTPLKYAVAGQGSNSHLVMELLQRVGGIKMIQVPYKGTADALRDVIGGTVDVYVDGAQTAVQNGKAGRVTMLGVSGETRLPAIPEVPTFAEQGFDKMNDGAGAWIGFFGPANMPPDVTARLHRELVKILVRPEMAAYIRSGGNEPAPAASSNAFSGEIRKEYVRIVKLFQQLDIKPLQ